GRLELAPLARTARYRGRAGRHPTLILERNGKRKLEGENSRQRHCHADHLEQSGIYSDGDPCGEETRSSAPGTLFVLRCGGCGPGCSSTEAEASRRTRGRNAFGKADRGLPVRAYLSGS